MDSSGLDSGSRSAADSSAAGLLQALMRAARRFEEVRQAIHADYYPHVGGEVVSDLTGRVVRVGLELRLPGGVEMVFTVTLDPGPDVFVLAGDVTLDDGEMLLALPQVETARVDACMTILERYVDEIASPARWYVTERLERL
ncbi:hypothetical protein J5X84_13050 [Streptosporangiaceae bacterium NEAU-GS5]|nr:hypothetical protein [Streptosporangiaceae bacterium NEAU-GS5]